MLTVIMVINMLTMHDESTMGIWASISRLLRFSNSGSMRDSGKGGRGKRRGEAGTMRLDPPESRMPYDTVRMFGPGGPR
jgi:hypothetical protein